MSFITLGYQSRARFAVLRWPQSWAWSLACSWRVRADPRPIFEPIFSFGYPFPKIALFPIFIFVFGLGHLSKVALVFLEALYPIAVGTYFGMKSIERIYVWSALNMGANPRQVFLRVLIPAALPYIVFSLRIGVHVALIAVIILEMIGDSTGLGYYVVYASASYEYARSFAGLVAIVFWGFVLDRMMVSLRRRVIFWQREMVMLC